MDQQRNGTQRSLFDSLPEALLAKILGRDCSLRRLCQLRTVSKSFYSAISHVDRVTCSLENAKSIEGQRLVRFLQGAGDRLTSLNIRCSSMLSSAYGYMFLTAALSAAKSLQSFTLNEHSMSYTDSEQREELAHQLFQTLSYLTQLESLSVSCCGVIIRSRLHLKPQLSGLLTLELVWAQVTDNGLASLLNACPSLQHLKLHYIDGLERPCLDCCTLLSLDWFDVNGGPLEKVDTKAPLLQSLRVPSSTEANTYAPNIDRLVAHFLGRLVCPPLVKLRDFQVCGCSWTKDQFLDVLSACKAAKVVDLGACALEQGARPVPIADILSPLKNVQQLRMSASLINACTIQPETKPALLLQSLEKLCLQFEYANEQLLLALQLVRISPVLKELVIEIDHAGGAMAAKELAILLKIQQHNPGLDLKVDY